MEIWKAVKGYEGLYEVSNFGNIKSLSRTTKDNKCLKTKILTGGNFSNGYRFVCLRKNGINRNLLIHRLVAEAFIKNEKDYSDVNHIDGNKRNNHVSNLEWCTRSENLKHALKIGLVKSQCKIIRKCTAINLSNSLEKIEFESTKQCSEYFGHSRGWALQKEKLKGNISFVYRGYLIKISKERG